MGDTSRIISKFEIFMEKVRLENQPGVKPPQEKEKSKIIGYFTYDFNKMTETYTSLTN